MTCTAPNAQVSILRLAEGCEPLLEQVFDGNVGDSHFAESMLRVGEFFVQSLYAAIEIGIAGDLWYGKPLRVKLGRFGLQDVETILEAACESLIGPDGGQQRTIRWFLLFQPIVKGSRKYPSLPANSG